MKALRTFGFAFLLLGPATAHPLEAQDTVRVVVVATTDVHGRVYHWDYVNDREAPWGLTRAATVVDSLRAEYPGQVILVDAGDLLQGNPFATFFATERPQRPHPIVDALNAVGYDVITLGNHEFNFGLDVLARALSAAAFPVVSANLFRLPRDTTAYLPHVVLHRGPVRVGVTGLTTPGVMVWDRDSVAGRVVVRRILPEANRAMRRLEAEGVDLKIVAAHTGLRSASSYDTTGVGGENEAARLAELPIKPDLVIVGHTHNRLTDMTLDGVHFMQPEPWARSLAVAHVWMVRQPGAEDEPGPYRVWRIESEQIALADVPPLPVVVQRLERAHQSVRLWVATPLANSQGDWSARYARAGDTPIIDFVNEVQRRTAGTQLSSTAAFSISAHLGPGAVRLRDVAGLYPYENTLKAVLIDGTTLWRYLEKSAEYFHTLEVGATMVDPDVPGYNFDIVSGVEYSLDLTRPPGSRVRQLTRRGQLVEPTDTFTLAINSYRQAGGGGFDFLRELPVVYDRGENIRDLLVNAVRDAELLRAEDYYEPSWSIVPARAAEAVRRTFSGPTETPAVDSARVAYREPVFEPPDTGGVRVELPSRPEPPLARLKFALELEEGESPLGRLVADAIRNGGRTQVAIVLNESIKAGLPQGAVRAEDMTPVLPDQDPLVRLTVPHGTLLSALENLLAGEQPIAHVAGIEVWYDPERPPGRRVDAVRFPDGRELPRNQQVTIAVAKSLADGAAEFAMVPGLSHEVLPLTAREALTAYLPRLRQPVDAPPDDRLHVRR